jgi:hypothetical protein
MRQSTLAKCDEDELNAAGIEVLAIQIGILLAAAFIQRH